MRYLPGRAVPRLGLALQAGPGRARPDRARPAEPGPALPSRPIHATANRTEPRLVGAVLAEPHLPCRAWPVRTRPRAAVARLATSAHAIAFFTRRLSRGRPSASRSEEHTS